MEDRGWRMADGGNALWLSAIFHPRSSFSSPDARHHGHHFAGRVRRAFAVVAMGAAEALAGLFLGIDREYAEDAGDHFTQRDVLDAACGFAGDVVEVRRVAAHDA